MLRRHRSRRTLALSPRISSGARPLRYETMEHRLVLSAAGFAGNECAPELIDVALDAIVPDLSFVPQSEITFQFSADEVVSDAGVGATAATDIRLILDPDSGPRPNGATAEDWPKNPCLRKHFVR